MQDDLVLYLLHLETPIGRASHYMGSTLRSRFDTRMQEHRQGKGSSLMKKARELGVGFYAMEVKRIENRTEEKREKNIGHYKRHCPLCAREPQFFAAVHYNEPLTIHPKVAQAMKKGWQPLQFPSP